MYRVIAGPTYALTTAVLVRSYSRISGQDLGGAGDVDILADDRADDLLDPALVRVVRVRVQQRDRDRLHVCGGDPRSDGLDLGLVELAPDLAPRAAPLADLEPETPRHERRRDLVLDVVENGDPESAHLEDVAEPRGGDQRRPRPEALEDRVGGDRRRVHDPRQLGPVDLALAEQRDGAGDDAAGVVVRRRQHLLRPHRAVVAEQHDVRERAADVDPEPVLCGAHLSLIPTTRRERAPAAPCRDSGSRSGRSSP